MNQRGLLALATALFAAAANAADVDVKSAWVRGTVPAQMVSGAYMELASRSEAALVGASTPVAEEAELHEMQLDGGVMKMRTVARLALPAGQTVSLKPGGYHIMLLGLKRQLKPGERVPIVLRIESGKKVETVTVSAEVRELDGSSAHRQHEHMH